MGQRLHSCLDLIAPDTSSKVQKKQQTQKFNHDHRARRRTLEVGDTVNVYNFSTGDDWLPGSIVKANRPLSLQSKLQDGLMVR